jgi:hypothetical protein
MIYLIVVFFYLHVPMITLSWNGPSGHTILTSYFYGTFYFVSYPLFTVTFNAIGKIKMIGQMRWWYAETENVIHSFSETVNSEGYTV